MDIADIFGSVPDSVLLEQVRLHVLAMLIRQLNANPDAHDVRALIAVIDVHGNASTLPTRPN